jgi:methionyl aminopeptidase
MIIYKSPRELEQMRLTGYHAHHILRKMAEKVTPGVTTGELNDVCRDELERVGGIGLSKNYPTYKPGEGYPSESCISVNDEIVHGIPGSRRLKEGDIVTLDLAMKLGDYCADNAITVGVGRLPPERKKLLDVTRETLEIAIQRAKPGVRWSDVAREMQRYAERKGYGVIRDFVGHGIGRKMHEDPKVPNYTNAEQRKSDFVLRPGMTFAVEPMCVVGKPDTKTLSDQWTIKTKKQKPAAHFEHTLAISEKGCEVLTDGRLPAGMNRDAAEMRFKTSAPSAQAA